LDLLSKQGKIIITTFGERGSRIVGGNQIIDVSPARPKSVSDPAGAGDAYRSGFIAGFMRGFPLATCGQMGSLSAIYTVEKYGTTTHRFTINQFERRYRENFGEEIKL
jgi:adenosine kinase